MHKEAQKGISSFVLFVPFVVLPFSFSDRVVRVVGG